MSASLQAYPGSIYSQLTGVISNVRETDMHSCDTVPGDLISRRMFVWALLRRVRAREHVVQLLALTPTYRERDELHRGSRY